MKINHEKTLKKQEEEFLLEKKRIQDIYILNKQKKEEERKKIEYDDLMEKIRLKNNYDEEIKKINQSHKIAMDYINRLYQYRRNALYNNNNIY